MLLPGVPLWLFWGQELDWSGGYGEPVYGLVVLLLIGLLMQRTNFMNG